MASKINEQDDVSDELAYWASEVSGNSRKTPSAYEIAVLYRNSRMRARTMTLTSCLVCLIAAMGFRFYFQGQSSAPNHAIVQNEQPEVNPQELLRSIQLRLKQHQEQLAALDVSINAREAEDSLREMRSKTLEFRRAAARNQLIDEQILVKANPNHSSKELQ
ncbi:MAG: hypothetical protein ABL921_11060 [Pirellula sp.]